MCFWGEALVLGPNINLPMLEEAVAPAFAAMQNARGARRQGGPARAGADRSAVDALRRRTPRPTGRRSIAAYAAAMAKVAAQFPDDNDIAVLYAESLMDLSPWNYWQPGGREPNPQSADIVPTLERVLAKEPEPSGRDPLSTSTRSRRRTSRKRAEPYADRLRGAIPGAGHLVHMPSHIYYRVGRYLDALVDNKTAVAVDEKYLAATRRADGRLPARLLSAQRPLRHGVGADGGRRADRHRGGGEAARPRSPTRLRSRHRAGASGEGRARTSPMRQFSPPETILALPDPGDAIPYVKAMWHYARGVAYAARHDLPAAARPRPTRSTTIERTATSRC